MPASRRGTRRRRGRRRCPRSRGAWRGGEPSTCSSACTANARARSSHCSSPVRACSARKAQPLPAVPWQRPGALAQRPRAPRQLSGGGEQRVRRRARAAAPRARHHARRAVAPLHARGELLGPVGVRRRRPVHEPVLVQRQRLRRLGGGGLQRGRPLSVEQGLPAQQRGSVRGEAVPGADAADEAAAAVLDPDPAAELGIAQELLPERLRAVLPERPPARLARQLEEVERRQHGARRAVEQLVRRVARVGGHELEEAVVGRGRRREPPRDEGDARLAGHQTGVGAVAGGRPVGVEQAALAQPGAQLVERPEDARGAGPEREVGSLRSFSGGRPEALPAIGLRRAHRDAFDCRAHARPSSQRAAVSGSCSRGSKSGMAGQRPAAARTPSSGRGTRSRSSASTSRLPYSTLRLCMKPQSWRSRGSSRWASCFW